MESCYENISRIREFWWKNSNVRKLKKNHIRFKKSIHFEWKKVFLIMYWIFYQSVKNSSTLLFAKTTEIMFKSNFWLGMYVPYIRKFFSSHTFRRVTFPVTLPVKSEIQRVFCKLPDETKIWKKINIQKELRTLILNINNSQKLLTN